MDKLVTVLRVSYPQQLWIIRGKLESEGIECFIQDELTIQAYNLYSNAVGGVKLQVLEKDALQAIEILTDLGYLKDEPVLPDDLTRIDHKTEAIPLLNRIPVKGRIVIISILASLILGVILYFILKPNLYKSLTATTWCVSHVVFNGKEIKLNVNEAISVRLVDINGNSLGCDEPLDLRKNKSIELPGTNGYVSGDWILNDDKTITMNVDELKSVYNGRYEIDISDNELQLTLTSKTTTIYANKTDY